MITTEGADASGDDDGWLAPQVRRERREFLHICGAGGWYLDDVR